MIAATFCGLTGEGEAVVGTLMEVTCAACQKVTDPDVRRYRGVMVPLTLGTELVHAGGLITERGLRRLLTALLNDVVACVFDPDVNASMIGLIMGEVQKLDDARHGEEERDDR